MPVEVIMPKVDMDMATGRIVKWHVAEGDEVQKDAALFDIETDKATMEVGALATGRLHHISAAEGEDIAVGAPVAWLYAEGEPVGPAPGAPIARAAAPATARPPAPVAPAGKTAAPAAPPPPEPDRAAAPDPMTAAAAHGGAVRATPLARRLAREGGLDLRRIEGTSLNGRITRGDIDAALKMLRADAPKPWPANAPRAPEPARAARAARAGAGDRTPFVLIHGFAADSTGWAKLEPLLPSGHPVLKLDLPGHGRAPALPVSGFPDLAQAMRQAFDALGEEPVHLIGHSLGGAAALALADTRPRRIASLTLLAPAGLGPEIDAPTLAGITRATRAESLAPWLKRLPADPDLISWNYVRAAMAARADPALRAAQAAMADALFPDGVQAFDLTAALDRLKAPTRIVWGRNDAIIPWRHALRAPGRVGLHLYERTGHLLHIERTEEIAMVLSNMAQMRVPGG